MFYIKTLLRGAKRIMTVPQLALPVLFTLSLTLAAVLTVIAISSNLIFKPLPDIKDEKSLYIIDYQLKFSDDLQLTLFDPTMTAKLNETYKQDGETAFSKVSIANIIINEQNYGTNEFSASDNFHQVVSSGRLLLGDRPSESTINNGIWISETLWQVAYQRQQQALGQPIKIGDKSYIIRGVWQDFSSYDVKQGDKTNQQVWHYQSLDELQRQPDVISLGVDTIVYYRPTQRLITTDDVEGFYAQIIKNLDDYGRQMMLTQREKTATIFSFRETLLDGQSFVIGVLLTAVFTLLLMATLNLLNLFISHYQQRKHEFATHYCFGAKTTRLFWLVFVENTPLFMLASLFGLLIAAWLIRLLPVISGGNINLLDLVHIDFWTVVTAVLTITLINSAFSFFAVKQFDANKLTEQLNTSNKGVNANQSSPLGKALFIMQISFATLILTATSVMAERAYRTVFPELGFTPGNTLFITFQAPAANQVDIDTGQMTPELMRQRAVAGTRVVREHYKVVTESILRTDPQLTVLESRNEPYGFALTMSFYQDTETNTGFTFVRNVIAPDFFTAFDIPLIAGRNFTENEYQSIAPVVVIDRHFAMQISKDGTVDSVIGTELMGSEVIGVVETIHRVMATDMPTVYTIMNIANSHFAIAVQAKPNYEFDTQTIHEAIQKADPQATNIDAESLEKRVNDFTRDQRLQFYFTLGLSLLCLLLAAVGSSGMAVTFAEMKHFELAVRMAMGAKRMRLMRLMLMQVAPLLVTAISVAIIFTASSYWLLTQYIDTVAIPSYQGLGLFSGLLVSIVLVAIITVVWRVINKEPARALREF